MSKFGLAAKGFFMGIAEAIPGVSGGTIAFITGIYQELIETINSFTPTNIKKLFSDPRDFWQSINGNFLLFLFIGMGAGLVFGVLVITHLLETQKEMLWAFFFGLVLASAVYLGKDVNWNPLKILTFLVGAIFAYFITTLTPSTGSDNLIYIFFAGSIAVSALMLPGISGSFMLLLFGLYHTVMFSFKELISGHFEGSHIGVLGALGMGILFGLFSFARILSYLFKHYAQSTMAFLIGILIGSLNKLWPWRIINSAFNKGNGQIVTIDHINLPSDDGFKILSESNIGPTSYATYGDPHTIGVIIVFLLGCALVGLMSKLDRSK